MSEIPTKIIEKDGVEYSVQMLSPGISRVNVKGSGEGGRIQESSGGFSILDRDFGDPRVLYEELEDAVEEIIEALEVRSGVRTRKYFEED